MLQEVTCNSLVKTSFVCNITSIIKIDNFLSSSLCKRTLTPHKKYFKILRVVGEDLINQKPLLLPSVFLSRVMIK